MDIELLRQFAGDAPHKPKSTGEVVDWLLAELKDLGIYVHNHAITTNSHYLKFADDRIGSIRVCDHPGKKKYAYRWNIWLDGIKASYDEVDRNTRRWHYLASDFDDFLRHVRNYAKALPPESEKQRTIRLDAERMDEEDWNREYWEDYFAWANPHG